MYMFQAEICICICNKFVKPWTLGVLFLPTRGSFVVLLATGRLPLREYYIQYKWLEYEMEDNMLHPDLQTVQI